MKSQLMIFLTELYPLVAAVVAMLVSQILKTIIYALKKETVELKTIGSTGGMPSSHSALVGALSTAVGLKDGWTSTTFCICVAFSLVVLYDAAGVRRAVGKQAKILNQMIEEVMKTGQFKSGRLYELLGHTPLEVIVGTLLGIGIGFTLYY